MLKQEDILTRIRAAQNEAPTGAFAVEIGSNEEVVGNLNSKHMYNQTVDKDNGMQKEANRYLEKIAASFPIGPRKSWIRRLGDSIKNADPLTQVGTAASITGLGLSVTKTQADRMNAKANMQRVKMEQRSLQALNGINKTLSTAVIAPSSMKVQRPKGIS